MFNIKLLYDIDGKTNHNLYYQEARRLENSEEVENWRKASDLYLRAVDDCYDIDLENYYYGCAANVIYKYISKLGARCPAEEFEYALYIFSNIPAVDRLDHSQKFRNKWSEIYYRYKKFCHFPKISFVNVRYLCRHLEDIYYQYAYNEEPECKVNRYAVIKAFKNFEEVFIPLSKSDELFSENTIGVVCSLSGPFKLFEVFFKMSEFSLQIEVDDADLLSVFNNYIRKYYTFMEKSNFHDEKSIEVLSSIIFEFFRRRHQILRFYFISSREYLLKGLEKGYIIIANDEDKQVVEMLRGSEMINNE